MGAVRCGTLSLSLSFSLSPVHPAREEEIGKVDLLLLCDCTVPRRYNRLRILRTGKKNGCIFRPPSVSLCVCCCWWVHPSITHHLHTIPYPTLSDRHFFSKRETERVDDTYGTVHTHTVIHLSFFSRERDEIGGIYCSIPFVNILRSVRSVRACEETERVETDGTVHTPFSPLLFFPEREKEIGGMYVSLVTNISVPSGRCVRAKNEWIKK